MKLMILGLLAGFLGLFGSGHFGGPSTILSTRQLFLAPPKALTHFSFGQREVFADLLWIRVIQDFDVCENPKAVKPATSPQDPSRCHKGWVYQMINSITDFAPKFRIAFSAGSAILSVGVDDREGAKEIFDKAVKHFPNDWPIAYRAAYHYLYEIGDSLRAAELFNLAAKNGAPPWAQALAGRLYSEAGQIELGIRVLTEYLEKFPDNAKAKERLALLLAKQAEKEQQARRPAKKQ